MDGRPWPRLARVIAVHPESHSVDIEYLRDHGATTDVPVMVGPASTNTGLTDLPVPNGAQGTGYTGTRDMTAVVDLVDGMAIVIGFLHSRISEMLFEDRERRVWRHASDVYTSLDADGNFEMRHPSGTFFRVGVTPDHEDLTAKNYDKNWAITRNTNKQVHANLEVWHSGVLKAKLHIDPSGNLTQILKGNVTQTIEGAVTQTVTGNVDVTTPKATVHGNAEVTGTVKMAGGTGNCVTTESICAFLGSPHPDGSTKVTAGS